MSDIRALEHSTLKVPYEILNKKFRVAQKTIDREVSHVQHAVNAVDKALHPVDHSVIIANVDSVVRSLLDKLLLLKDRSSQVLAEETEAAAVIQKRIRHLKVGTDPKASDAEVQQWRNNRIDRLLIEYLLRSGNYETAAQLAASNRLEYMSNLNVFLAAREVEESLARHETQKCLDWCYDNRSKLRRLRSRLELRVREQEFIELIRQGKRKEAVDYSRKFFSGVDNDLWSELGGIVVLLAFGPETEIPEYKSLYSEARWSEMIKLFREENFRLYQLAHQSVFSACLQSGLSALKTPECSANSLSKRSMQKAALAVTTRKRKECPVCLPDVQGLVTNLPYAHASQSRLVCAYSGEPLNENNPPMMLPNGMVYGKNSLEGMALRNDGQITCPRTGLVTSLDQTLRVYVM